mmetsp:Transcript_9162/g.29550  ORF Transcript_9162/g.29550 Transcript_9162/m.29550 type:complete len:234 (-) Transcript_9162:206-907(-)
MTKLAGHSGKPTWFAVATSLSKYPFVSSQILYNASNAPSNAFGSFEASKFSAINCHNCGADCHPFCRTHIANDVPTTRLTILDGCVMLPVSASLMNDSCGSSENCQVVFKLFFSKRPAVCRTSSPYVPSPLHKINAKYELKSGNFEHSCSLWYINCWFAFGWMYSCKSCPTCCTPSCAGCHDDDDAIFPFPLILFTFVFFFYFLPIFTPPSTALLIILNYYSLLLLLPVSLSL